MKDYKKANILLKQLYEIIRIEGRGSIDYYIREIARIIYLLDDYEQNANISEIKEIDKLIKDLYARPVGLNDFYIWSENEEERIRLNEPISSINDQLWKMFKDA